jgi:hypothetical protein
MLVLSQHLLFLCFLYTQSTIDYVGYATGQSDEWRGAGVWSGLSLKRESEEKDGNDDDKNAKNAKTPTKETSQQTTAGSSK